MERYTRIRKSQIKDIAPSDITENATNSPNDGQIPSKATGTDEWTWIDTIDASVITTQIILRNIYNIVLNAFRIAINGSLTKFNMLDGIVDEFEDESGVDTSSGASDNQIYDSTNDLYKPDETELLDLDYMEYSSDEDARNAYNSDTINEILFDQWTSTGAYYQLKYNTNLQKLAQSFTPASTLRMASVELYIAKVGSPTGSCYVYIYDDNSGEPGSIISVQSSTRVCTSLSTSNTWYSFTFATPCKLTAGQVYWISFEGTNAVSSSNYISVNGLDGDTGGTFYVWNGSAWSSRVFDMDFKAYTEELQCFSEDTIKEQGSYSLYAFATASALYDSLTRKINPTWDLIDEDFEDISDWDDQDAGSGVSSEDPSGQLKLDSGGSTGAGNYAQRRNTNALSTLMTVQIKVYHDAIGTVADGDYFRQRIRTDAGGTDTYVDVYFASDGLFVDDGVTRNEVGTDLVKYGGSAEWQEWRFIIDSSTPASATMDIYLNDSTHDWEKVGTNVDCSRLTDGAELVHLMQIGITTANRITHVDYIKVATGSHIPFATDLSGQDNIYFDARASRTGSNFKLELPNNPTWDILDSAFDNLTNWVDNDNINGVSEISPAGFLRLDCNNSAGTNRANRDNTSITLSDIYTVEFKVRHNALGTTGNIDYFQLTIENNVGVTDHYLFLALGTDGAFISDGVGTNEVGTNEVSVGEWTIWRFIVDSTIPASATCDVYKNNVLLASSVDCSYTGSGLVDTVRLIQRGATTNDMLSHVDYIRIATGSHPPAVISHDVNISLADTWQEETINISGVADGDKDNIEEIILQIIEASADNEIYIDNIRAGIEETLNMTLVSENTEAETEPDNVRMVLFEEDVDSITINTDLKAYASRDDGANWVQATLADEGDYETGKRILVATADVSGQASDKTMRWKTTTHNNKALKLHGIGLLWD